MISTEQQVQHIERDIKASKKIIEVGDALSRLKSNRDFKKIVLEDYFEQEAIRLVHLKSDSNMQSTSSQEVILKQMDAIGTFKSYLQMVERNAELARKTLVFNEQMRDEILQGEEEWIS